MSFKILDLRSWVNPSARTRKRRGFRNGRKKTVISSIEIYEARTLLSGTSLVDDHHYELVDAAGNEYHALALPDPALTPETTGNVDGAGTLSPLDSTFELHSNPNATHTNYLDFEGETTSGTIWKNSFNNGEAINTPAFDFEGGTGLFTDNELVRIQYIWQRVAEDFLPFNVNVTTEDPGVNALAKSGTGDDAWGIHVVIDGNGSWYGSAGGVRPTGGLTAFVSGTFATFTLAHTHQPTANLRITFTLLNTTERTANVSELF